MTVANAKEIQLDIVGSSTFGRYPKISIARTVNMFISDNWLVNYPGFKLTHDFVGAREGRGLFHSTRGNFLLCVIGSGVYRINSNGFPVQIGSLNSSRGEVSIDENLNSQVCIVDGEAAYIYSYLTGELTQQTLTWTSGTVVPGYVSYHNIFFLFASTPTSDFPQNWYAFEPHPSDDNLIVFNSDFALQTKPDNTLAVIRQPGRGNNVLVIGESVSEVWQQVGGAENYRRIQTFNIDSGAVSPFTIAASDEFVVWVAQNEKSSPTLMVTDGAHVESISSDGISFLLQSITHPEESSAFFYRIDGHLFYQFTFFNEEDNLSMVYDFDTKKFYDVTDENNNFHPARQAAYFNNTIFFVSIKDAGLYETSTNIESYIYSTEPTAQGEQIPRIRICTTARQNDSSPFRVGEVTFWIEQGVNDYLFEENTYIGQIITEQGDPIISESGNFLITEDGYFTGSGITAINSGAPKVDFSFSKNGNQSFSAAVPRFLNTQGNYRNILRWQRIGQANEFTAQFRFWGFQRFVVTDGVLRVY